MPNRFWPNNTSELESGNEIYRNAPVGNPDVFCESQQSGYRLPSISEFNSGRRTNFGPWGPNSITAPAHWSAYKDNNINSSLLPNINGRAVSGSLANEWGDLSAYSSGWVVGAYWATEPSYVYNAIDGAAAQGRGRYFLNVVAGNNPNLIAYQFRPQSGSTTLDLSTTALGYVACVRDLVPTPSTLVPGKS